MSSLYIDYGRTFIINNDDSLSCDCHDTITHARRGLIESSQYSICKYTIYTITLYSKYGQYIKVHVLYYTTKSTMLSLNITVLINQNAKLFINHLISLIFV